MKSQATGVIDVDGYIKSFPEETQKRLARFRAIIINNAAGAEEAISYKMPGYKFHGILVYFAGYEHHIGFYPMPSAIEAFKKELAVYKSAKGSVQFPLDKPLPVQLIKKIVVFRMKENIKKAAIKRTQK